jgi:hypothetical protein
MLTGCAVRPAPIVDAMASERARVDAAAPDSIDPAIPTVVPDLLAAVPREGAWMGLALSLGLRPELLEIARDHTNAEHSQVAISIFSVSVAIKGAQWRDHQRTCSRPGTQPRS